MIATTIRLALAAERAVTTTTIGTDGATLAAASAMPIAWDDRHLAFAADADAAIVGNLGRNPSIVLILSEPRGSGWRFDGYAAVLSSGELHRRLLTRLRQPCGAVVLMQVDRARKLAAPGNDTGATAGRAA